MPIMPRFQTPITTEQQAAIAVKVAQGIPNTQVAEQLGIHRDSVAKYRKRLKDKIESITERYIMEAGDKVIQADIAILTQVAEILDAAIKPTDLTDYQQVIMSQAESVRKRICGIMGLAPTSTVSHVMQTIYNDNRSTTLNPAVLNLITGSQTAQAGAGPALEALDCEYAVIDTAVEPVNTACIGMDDVPPPGYTGE